MKNTTQLRNSLAENYDKMASGEMPLKQGKELANTAGKILNSLKVELEYNQYTDNKRTIEFLENQEP